jgi:cytochrome b6-f complex iron-sulfur subunit
MDSDIAAEGVAAPMVLDEVERDRALLGRDALRDGPAGAFGRRRLLRYLMGFSVVSTIGMIMTPVIGFLIPPRTSGAAAGGRILAGTIEDIPPGQGKVVPMGSSPVIVVNEEQGTVKAFSAICPHLGCVVAWDAAARNIVCPCHDGRFSAATGAVVSGPPPAPLPPVATAVEDGQIFLVGS